MNHSSTCPICGEPVILAEDADTGDPIALDVRSGEFIYFAEPDSRGGFRAWSTGNEDTLLDHTFLCKTQRVTT